MATLTNHGHIAITKSLLRDPIYGVVTIINFIIKTLGIERAFAFGFTVATGILADENEVLANESMSIMEGCPPNPVSRSSENCGGGAFFRDENTSGEFNAVAHGNHVTLESVIPA